MMMYEGFLDWFKSKKEPESLVKPEKDLGKEIEMRIKAGEAIEKINDKLSKDNEIVEFIDDSYKDPAKISHNIAFYDDEFFTMKVTIEEKVYYVDINDGEIQSEFRTFLNQDQKHIKLLHDILSICHMVVDDRNA